ncbi:ankyrin repeat domain-containing protein [bacterium]|nr:ankyrin repeat domain-containing protein [bacterium]
MQLRRTYSILFLLASMTLYSNSAVAFSGFGLEKSSEESRLKFISSQEIAKKFRNTSGSQCLLTMNLYKAILEEDLKAVSQAISCGAEVNPSKWNYITNDCLPDSISPLRLALILNNYEIVSVVLSAGAPVNERAENDSLATPLMVAAAVGNDKICSLLISAGAKVNEVGDTGYTALDLAIVWNSMRLKFPGNKYLAEHDLYCPVDANYASTIDVLKKSNAKSSVVFGDDGYSSPNIYSASAVNKNLSIANFLSFENWGWYDHDLSKFKERMGGYYNQTLTLVKSQVEAQERENKLKSFFDEANDPKQMVFWKKFMDFALVNDKRSDASFDKINAIFVNGRESESRNELSSNVSRKIGKPVFLFVEFESNASGGILASIGRGSSLIYLSGVKPGSVVSGEKFNVVGKIGGTYTYTTVLGSKNTVPRVNVKWKY